MNTNRRWPWIAASFWLVTANGVAGLANFIFQILMRRGGLTPSEFGAMNSTLAIIGLATVPAAAAAQAITRAVSTALAKGEFPFEKSNDARTLLRAIAIGAGLLIVFLLPPFCVLYQLPRIELGVAAVLCAPLMIAGILAQAWQAGAQRFWLLGFWLIAAASVRLVAGWCFARHWPHAEGGVLATALAGGILATGLTAPLWRTQPPITKKSSQTTTRGKTPWPLLGAAASVGIGSQLFLWGDQLVAQRITATGPLGDYTTAGLLGRAILWAALPILTVYLARRSSETAAAGPSWSVERGLLLKYAALVLAAWAGVSLFRQPLLMLFTGDAPSTARAGVFLPTLALAMLPVALLQAVGLHWLAVGHYRACNFFGALALLHLAILTLAGTELQLLPSLALGSTGMMCLLIGASALITRARKRINSAAR